MKIKIIILTGLFIALNFAAIAQQSQLVPLKIGDKIPDFVFRDIQNKTGQTQNASAMYHDGLLIINFWATWCVPCVNSLPFLDTIQVNNPANYHMVCLTNEPAQRLTEFLAKHPELQHLAFATDTLIGKYFPHETIPHNIWIDKNGIIRAITNDEEVTDEHVKTFLLGQIKLAFKDDDMSFDWRKNLVVADTEFTYRSVLTPAKPRIGDGGILLPYEGAATSRLLAWNRSRTDLLWTAFIKSGMNKRDWKLLEIHTRDSSKFFYPAYTNEPNWTRKYGLAGMDKWSSKNQFCYEIAFPKKVNPDDLYRIMGQELSICFNVKAEIVDKPVDCWVITKIPGKYKHSRPGTTKSEPIGFRKNETGTAIESQNLSLKEIADQLSAFYSQEPPIIDLTGIKDRISLNHQFDQPVSIQMMQAYLTTLGLNMQVEKHLYPTLVIYDLDN